MMDAKTLKDLEQRIEATNTQLLAAQNVLQGVYDLLNLERMKWHAAVEAANGKAP